jgi:hypothetical protein
VSIVRCCAKSSLVAYAWLRKGKIQPSKAERGVPMARVAYSRISSVIRFEESILLRSARSASVCGGSDCLYALKEGRAMGVDG